MSGHERQRRCPCGERNSFVMHNSARNYTIYECPQGHMSFIHWWTEPGGIVHSIKYLGVSAGAGEGR